MSTAATPAPGQLITFFKALDTHRTQGRRVSELPPRDCLALHGALEALQYYMQRDPHVGPMLEGAVQRIGDAVAQDTLGTIQKHDLRTVQNFLTAVPTTVRGH
jgi:hypothetical protein